MWHDYLQESRIHPRESLLQRMVRNVDIDNIRIAALAGGVGGARMLDGFAALGLDDRLTAVVNTADDFELWGLYISPDIDTVLYTLSGLANVEQGWGIAGIELHVALIKPAERFLDGRPRDGGRVRPHQW